MTLTVNQNRQHSKNYMANSVDPDQAEKLTVEAAVSTHWKHLIDMLLINTQNRCFHEERSNKKYHTCKASDFFQDWWADVTHGAKNGGSFSEMMGPSISN